MKIEEEFLLQEHKYHMEKIGQLQKDRFNFIRLSLGGTIAFYTLILSPRFGLINSPHFETLKLLPVGLNLFGLLVTHGMRLSIRRHAAYIMKLEEQVLGAGNGWETNIRDPEFKESFEATSVKRGFSDLPLTTSNYAYWIAAIVATIVLANAI